MSDSRRIGARWASIALGWLVALLAGAMISPVLWDLFGLGPEPPGERGDFTAAVVVFLVSGFLVYLLGGYVAARLAGHPRGLNGAMTAVFGLIFGVILGFFGASFAFGVALPPINFGSGVGIWLTSLVPFLINLLGGYVGGKLGEPSRLQARRFG